MKALNVIVHTEYLLEDPNAKNYSVLERIRQIKKTSTKTINIPKKDGVTILEQAQDLIPKAKKYELVTLYGCSRKACLKTIAIELYKAGIPVEYDIKGTI